MSPAAVGVLSRPDLSSVPPRPRPVPTANATLVARLDATPSMARFRIRPDAGPLHFVAGQYALIGLADSVAPPRPYSIASRPGARDVEFVISLVPDGILTPRLFELDTGARLHVGPARGLFRLDPQDERHHLLIGTGSGVAPLLAMVADLRGRSEPPSTTLLHGARVRQELAGSDELHPIAGDWLSYRPCLSRPAAEDGWCGRTGRVGSHLHDLLASEEFVPDRTVAYLCGNPAMISDCEAILTAAGLTRSTIRVEQFTAA